MRGCFIPLVLAGSFLSGCGPSGSKPVTIYAAASTREAVDQLAKDFTNETGVVVKAEYGASSTLARQIEEGAPADLFLSADEPWAEELEKRDLVEERRNLLGNGLVVVVPADSALEFKTVHDVAQPGIRRLALAGPEVPAGRYAREALTKTGVWDEVKDRVKNGGDVRATLNYVALGEADAGIVYATDTAGTSKVRKVREIPPELHSPIRYPLVVLRRPVVSPGAIQFRDYLTTEKARAVFEKAGFTVLP
jgi:molybdate transport system substrate-binding protein